MTDRSLYLILLLFFAGCVTAPGHSSTPTVDFEMHRNLVFVPVFINGEGPFNMMIDTGTSPSAIDTRVVKQLGLQTATEGERGVGSGTDEIITYATSLPAVRVGSLHAGTVEASTADLSAIGTAIGIRLDGILGHSFLNDRVVEIDFPGRVMRFSDAGPAVSRERGGRTIIPFRYAHDSILIDDASINGKRVTALFDTGFNGAFNIMPAAVETLGLHDEFAAGVPGSALGYAGKSTNRKGSVAELRLGALRVSSPSVIFWEPGTGHDSTSWSFTVGTAFIQDFIVIIDYPRHLIILEDPA